MSARARCAWPLAACALLFAFPLVSRGEDAASAPRIRLVGSDSMEGLVRGWTEAFEDAVPGIGFALEAQGSSTGPPALIAGEAEIAPMSRELSGRESEAFQRAFGYAPTRFLVAVDAVAVFVHASNPLEELTLPELDAIYSSDRRCGARDPIARWADLGVEGEWALPQISACGRGPRSDAQGFFRNQALCGGSFREGVLELPGDVSVVRWIDERLCAIGYASASVPTDGVAVRALALAERAGGEHFTPNDDAVARGRYPLSRSLAFYVNRPPRKRLARELETFLRYVLSDEGQALVRGHGFLPLTPGARADERQKLP